MALSKSSIYVRLSVLGALSTPLLIVVLHQLGYEVKLWGCPLKALIGIPCPTWGMTRAVLAMVKTQWSSAMHYHHLAPLIVILWAMTMGQISLELLIKRSVSRWWRRRYVWLSGLCLLLGYHGYRLHGLWISGTLATDIQQSLLSRLL